MRPYIKASLLCLLVSLLASLSARGQSTVAAIYVSAPGLSIGSLALGTTTLLSATAMMTNGTTANVSNQVLWTSLNHSVANISRTGVVTPVNVGSASFIASFGGQSSNVFSLNMVAPATLVVPISIQLSSPSGLLLAGGGAVALQVIASLSGGQLSNVSSTALYHLSDATIGTVTGSLITPVKTGNVTVYATYGSLSSNTITLTTIVGVPGLSGPAGPTGAPGATGASAYQVALQGGYSGTILQWLASLNGLRGPTGLPGPAGSTPAGTGIFGVVSGAGSLASAHLMSLPANCISFSGSHTAYACTTTPTFTPALGDHIEFESDLGNTGAATLAVNGSGPVPIKKLHGTANLVANDIQPSGWIGATYDGAYWQLEGQLGNDPAAAAAIVATNLANEITARIAATSAAAMNTAMKMQAGELSFAGTTTQTYVFPVTYTIHPEVTLTPQFNTNGNAPWVTYTGVTSFTVNFASVATGAVTYWIGARN